MLFLTIPWVDGTQHMILLLALFGVASVAPVRWWLGPERTGAASRLGSFELLRKLNVSMKSQGLSFSARSLQQSS